MRPEKIVSAARKQVTDRAAEASSRGGVFAAYVRAVADTVAGSAPTEIPDFTEYEEALAWVDQRATDFGGRRTYRQSSEYAALYPVLRNLRRKERDADDAVRHAEARRVFDEGDLAVGDRLVGPSLGPIYARVTLRGTLTMRKGVPYVKVDPNAATQRTYVPLTADWTKAS